MQFKDKSLALVFLRIFANNPLADQAYLDIFVLAVQAIAGIKAQGKERKALLE